MNAYGPKLDDGSPNPKHDKRLYDQGMDLFIAALGILRKTPSSSDAVPTPAPGTTENVVGANARRMRPSKPDTPTSGIGRAGPFATTAPAGALRTNAWCISRDRKSCYLRAIHPYRPGGIDRDVHDAVEQGVRTAAKIQNFENCDRMKSW
jgi:hypothetical protein